MRIKKLTTGIRIYSLLGLAALVVAYVRTYLQYGEYGWNSFAHTAMSWFLHYAALVVMAAISHVAINGYRKYFFEKIDQPNEIRMEQTIYHVAVFALVAAVGIFFLAHWVPSGDLRY